MGITKKNPETKQNFYSQKFGLDKNVTKLLFWGRLDWHYKGIDRLLKAIKEIKNSNKYNYKPFKLFIIGPDYNNTLSKLNFFVQKNKLEDVIIFVNQNMYKRGSIDPLRDADVNILLSRWDYFPRTLRESCFFGVPMLVSEETNFGDLIRKFNAGVVSKNPDDITILASEISLITHSKYREELNIGCVNLSKYLDWNNVARIVNENLKFL